MKPPRGLRSLGISMPGEPMEHRDCCLAPTAVVLLWLLLASCSDEGVSSAPSGGADQHADAETSEFAGMYGWAPEGGFHNAVWSGALVIDGPCVYLDVSDQDGIPVPGGKPLRSFVRLPEPLTHYGSATGEIWVGEHGPMSTGDDVVLVGSEGWQRHWNQAGEDTHVFEFVRSNPADPTAYAIPVCAAHVSFYAASMRPSDSQGEEATIDTAKSTRLLGLFPWDTDQAHTDVGVDLVLVLEPPCVYAASPAEYPCVYLYPRDNNEALHALQESEITALSASRTPSGERALLSLVRDWTDYDPEANALTFREVHYVEETDSYAIGAEGSGEGPIASGDRVELAGIGDLVIGHEDVCQRDFDITVEYMSLCRLHACRMEREARRQADTTR